MGDCCGQLPLSFTSPFFFFFHISLFHAFSCSVFIFSRRSFCFVKLKDPSDNKWRSWRFLGMRVRLRRRTAWSNAACLRGFCVWVCVCFEKKEHQSTINKRWHVASMQWSLQQRLRALIAHQQAIESVDQLMYAHREREREEWQKGFRIVYVCACVYVCTCVCVSKNEINLHTESGKGGSHSKNAWLRSGCADSRIREGEGKGARGGSRGEAAGAQMRPKQPQQKSPITNETTTMIQAKKKAKNPKIGLEITNKGKAKTTTTITTTIKKRIQHQIVVLKQEQTLKWDRSNTSVGVGIQRLEYSPGWFGFRH